MQKLVVQMKDELEKIKEQLLKCFVNERRQTYCVFSTFRFRKNNYCKTFIKAKRLEFRIFNFCNFTRTREVKKLMEKIIIFYLLKNLKTKLKNDEFLEWEEVYRDNFYGTLKTEVERIWDKGKTCYF